MNWSSLRRLWQSLDRPRSRQSERARRRLRSRPTARLALEALEDRIVPTTRFDHLVITVQPPATVTAGAPFGLTVKVETSANKVDTAFTGTVNITDFSQTLGGTTSHKAVSGVVTFSVLTLKQAGSFEYLYVSSPGVTGVAVSSAYTNDFNVTAAQAAKLVDAGPPGDVVVNTPFNHSFNAEDPYGNIDPNFNGSVTVALGPGSPSATLGGTLTVPASSGTVTFSDLTLDQYGTGYTLQATATGLTAVTSAAFNATPQWVVTTQPPSSVTAGDPFGLTVTAEDGAGNIDTALTGNVTIANTAGVTMGGTLAMPINNGSATWTDLTITTAGDYQLTASSTGVASGTSQFFSITGGTANHLAITTQPPSPQSPGNSPFTVVAQAQDQYDNPDPNFNGSLSIALDNNPTGAKLQGTLTTNASGGSAYFDGLAVDRAGSGYTLTVNSTGLGSVTTSAFDAQDQLVAATPPPSNIVVGTTFSMVVDVEVVNGTPDPAYNGPVSMIVDNFSGGSTDTFRGPTSVNAVGGVATFAGLSLGEVGSYGFVVQAAGMNDLPLLFSIIGGPATQLAVTTQPALVTAGTGFSLTVNAEDPAGNLDPTYYGSVTLTLASNPGGATLGGPVSGYAYAGVAQFSGLTLDHTGSGYTLQATSGSLISTVTAPIHALAPGQATHLVVTTQPPFSVAAGTGFGLKVKAEDDTGKVDTSFNGAVTIAATDGTAINGKGAVAINAGAGLATFAGLTMTQPGTYTLVATSGSLGSATTSNLSITPAKGAKIVVGTPTTNVLTATTFGVPITILDRYGNVATGYYGLIKLAMSKNPSKATLGGTLNGYAASGMVTITGPTINKAGIGYTLSASATGLAVATSPAFNVTADQLWVTTQPGDPQTLGAPFSIAVSAENGAGTVDTAFNGNATVTLVDIDGTGAALGGAAPATFHNGVATFSGLTVNLPGTYALTVSAPGVAATMTSAFSAHAVATQLVVTMQPPSSITAGAGFGLAVSAEDARGNVDTTVQGTVALAILNNPAGGTLGGTVMATLQNGVAIFSGLTLDTAGNGYTLQATSGSLSSATTNGINVAAAGVATQLVITTPPPGMVATGATFGLVVKAEDATGAVDTNYRGIVRVALNSGSGAALGGTFNMPAGQGVATFTDLTLTPPGYYGLTVSAVGLSTQMPFSMVVTPAPASTLAPLAVPATILANTPFNVSIIAVDGQGNIDPTFQGNVTLALGANTAGATLQGTTTVPAQNGIAAFTGVHIDQAATGLTLMASAGGVSGWTSAPFDVAAAQLVVTTQPPATVAAGTGFKVVAKVEDSQGRVVTGFNGTAIAAINAVGSDFGQLGGPVTAAIRSGVATFANLSVTTPGVYALQLTGPTLADAVSNAFAVTGGRATQLVLTTLPPGTVTAGNPFEVDITAEDAHGNPDPNFTGTVTLTQQSGPAGATLGGTLMVPAVQGVARVPGLSLSPTGTYTLKATATGVTSATTPSIIVTPAGTAAQLILTAPPPGSITSGDTFDVTVTAEDNTGTPDANFSGSVTLAINNGGTLNGNVTMPANHGVATFSGLSIAQAGSYTLSATSGALVPAPAGISVNAASATTLEVQVPSAALPGLPFEVDVFALDGHQNLDTSFNGNVTVSLANNPGGATLGGTFMVPAQNGVAAFTDLTLDKTGTGYTIQAAGTSLPASTSTGFDVDQDQLVVIAQPPTVVVTGSGFGITVKAENSAGQVDTSFGGSITLNLQRLDGNTGSLGGRTTVTVQSGVATFTGLSVTQPGSDALGVTSAGLVPTSTSSFIATGTTPANTAPKFTNLARTVFTVGQFGTFQFTTTGYPAPTLSTSSSLPAGLSFSDNMDGTATLSGTPTAATTSPTSLVITATNGVTPGAQQTFSLTINQPPTINSFSPPTFNVGQNSTFSIGTTPGTPATTTVSESGPLPQGLSLSTTGGTLTLKGMPAAGTGGTYPITIMAKNAPGSATSQTFTLTVDESPAFTSPSTVVFGVGQPASFVVHTRGYPIASLSAPGLPTGLSFTDNHNDTATITGMPNTATTTTVTIAADNGVSVQQSLKVIINQPPNFNSFSPPTFAVGTTSTFSITTNPGVPAATTLTEHGTLPAGVSFSAVGGIATLKGKPAANTGGTYAITIIATTASGATALETFTLTVQQPPAFTSAPSANFALGTPVHLRIATKGYPFASLSESGVLPGGISFTSDADGTATLSGTPIAGTAGTYTLTLTAGNGLSPNATQRFTLTVR